MKDALKKGYNFIIKIENIFARTLLIIIIILTFIAAISRAIDVPLPWSLDLTLLLFAWFAFLSASQSTRRNANLGVDIIVRHLPKNVQNIIELFNKSLIVAFLAYIGYYCTNMAIIGWKQKITALNISYSFVTISLVVGCILMIISTLIQMVQRIMVIRGTATDKDFA